jgi:hypothetical protein
MQLSTLIRGRSALLALTLFTSLLLGGCGNEDGKNPVIPGIQGPTLTLVDDGLLVSMVFEALSLDGGLRYPIPDYEESYIELSPDLTSGGSVLAIFVSFVDVFDNGDFLRSLDPQTLPGGRPIPGLAAGRLPAVAFQIPDAFDMGFYIGDKLYGIWVPLDLGLDGAIATLRFYSEGRRVGNISLVGSDSNGDNSGIFLALDLSSSTASKVKRRR